ncbi:MAG: peptidoglycan DD-metalloendopeptidase family protein [Leptolyngbyaceae cyanobacterium T60_A2020_046]|nr:peptidoglycan DD-metalloendopeptidase family protein [Leptolyngbyaceae cyanobacterium T60_A2020_046]
MQREQLSSNSSQIPSDRGSFLPSLWRLGSLGLLGGGLMLFPVAAYAEGEPEAAQSEVQVAPVETTAESLLRPQETPAPVPAPRVVAPEPAPQPSASPAAGAPPSAGVFIDPTDYSVGATRSPDSPTLVFTDRATGCQLTLAQGQSAPSRNCGTAGRNADGNGGAIATQGNASGDDSFAIGPVSIGSNGVSVGNTTIISREALNEKLRPLNLLRRGFEEFVFPLATPAPISSLFGWRTHPIFGDQRFHAGTDLAAPTGTPVLAVKAGVVSTANYLGGYGLTVILRHEDGTQETRYAHLSRIMVNPGEAVEQGDVIGLVGSTGNSTGPHLHLELRELTAQGWVLVNPDEMLAYASASLMDALNNPLQALGLTERSPEEIPMEPIPFRPAQPNAS